MAEEAGQEALADAGISYDKIEQAAVGYCYGDSTCGQRAVYTLGLTGIPIYNVNNNCATGSTALFMAKQFVQAGIADCVLALGFEKMEKGSLGIKFADRTNPMDKHAKAMIEQRGFEKAPPAAQFFGNAGREHMERYGTTPDHFAKIGWKNHKHSVNNPYSQFQDEYSLEDIKNAPMVFAPLTKLQCCPTSDGAGRGDPRQRALRARAQARGEGGRDHRHGDDHRHEPDVRREELDEAGRLRHDQAGRAQGVRAVGRRSRGRRRRRAARLLRRNELITYEALGLCPEGKAGEFVDSGAQTYGGQVVVNPSGGLISKGHPLGATGLAQCAELNWQLRGQADKRQVAGAKIALQHNLGLGGAAVVTAYRKGF
jgi:sterol carrier protein 2